MPRLIAAILAHCTASYAMLFAALAVMDRAQRNRLDNDGGVLIVLYPLVSWYQLLERLQPAEGQIRLAVVSWSVYLPVLLAGYVIFRRIKPAPPRKLDA